MLRIGKLSEETFLFKEMTWKIPKDKVLPNVVNYDLQSPIFSFAGATWALHVYPYGRTASNSVGWIEFVIERLYSKIPQHHVFCKFYVKTSRGTEYNSLNVNYVLNSQINCGWLLYIRKKNFSTNKKTITTNGFIIIECQMRTQNMNGIEVFPQTDPAADLPKDICQKNSLPSTSRCAGCDGKTLPPLKLPGIKMVYDYKELFLKKEDCDAIIKVKGQEFPVHRIILRARSPVFASAFRNNMKEKNTGIIDIEDCDPSSFSDFLCFLYSGNVENLTTGNVFGLFTAADKYEVQDLRSECLEFMKKNLSIDTFCDTIGLALQHSEKDLIELSTKFFAKNLQEIIVTVKWQSFLLENPIQSNELLIKALVANKK